jgi:hypothetical protein
MALTKQREQKMNSNTQHFGGEAMHSQSTRTVASHPMRELLNHLRQVQTVAGRNGSGSIPTSLRQPLTENAEIVMAVCQNGMAALGQLLAHSSPVIEDGTVGADSVEALGWLIAELGDMTAYCLVLAAECRRDPSCAGLSKVA